MILACSDASIRRYWASWICLRDLPKCLGRPVKQGGGGLESPGVFGGFCGDTRQLAAQGGDSEVAGCERWGTASKEVVG